MAHRTNAVEDFGKLLLRLTVGVLLLLHGLDKVFHGVAPIAGMLAKHDVPGEIAYLAYAGEVLAPLLLVLGLWTRPAALVVVIHMAVALWLAHLPDLLTIGRGGGWAIELQAFYLLGALAIALLGAGRFSATGAAGRFN